MFATNVVSVTEDQQQSSESSDCGVTIIANTDTTTTTSEQCLDNKQASPIPDDVALLELFKEWNSKIEPDQQILLNDYIFKDPIIKKLKPTEAYCYTLGNVFILQIIKQTVLILMW